MKLHATKKDLLITESERLISGSVNIYTCEFTFDKSWKGYTVTAVFSTGNRLVNMAIIDGKCDIPVEVLKPNARIRIGVFGVDGSRRRPTTYSEWITVEQGADTSGNAGKPPTPTIYEQWITARDDKEENEAYANAMAYNVASYFCNMIPESTDCVVGNPVRQKTFVPVYNSKESVLYTNLLRYDAVIDNQSTFGHYVPAGKENTEPDTESGADADTETDIETDIDSDPESGAGEQPQRGITQDGNHDVLNVGGTNYPIMYMACSNFLMLLTKNRAYENSPWYKLFTDKDATPRQLAALCLERGDTDKTPWTFDCLNVAISWRIAEVMRSSGCTPFLVTNKSEDGVVTWDAAGVDKMRDGDIMFAGKPQYPNRYKGIYHCMMYFRDLDRINAAAKAWGADVELRGFDEARNMGFSGKYGYVVHCGGGTDESDVDDYDVKIKNVIRIETMERFMANTGKGVTVWGVRAASNAMNSTKLHQGVTGRMVLYDCVLVSSYRHNTDDKENKTISYQYVEAMRSGKDRNNGVFSYGQYRYSQIRSPVTTEEIDGETVKKTLNFNDFVGSKKSGTYCVWTSDVNLENGPTDGNVTEGSSVLKNPTKQLFMLEVKCVSISAAYAIQRVTTLTSVAPKVWERTFNHNGVPSKWREMCDVTNAHGGGSTGGGTGISAAAAQLLITILSNATFVSDQSANIQRLGELLNSSGSTPDEPDTPTTQKLTKPVIRLETVTDDGDDDPGDTGDNTPAILGRAVLGRTILGVTDGVDIPKLAKPVIRLETEADPDAPTLPKLAKPVISLETVADPEPEPDPEPELEKLAKPEIHLKVEEESLPKLSKPVIRFDYTVDGEDF